MGRKINSLVYSQICLFHNNKSGLVYLMMILMRINMGKGIWKITVVDVQLGFAFLVVDNVKLIPPFGNSF